MLVEKDNIKDRYFFVNDPLSPKLYKFSEGVGYYFSINYNPEENRQRKWHKSYYTSASDFNEPDRGIEELTETELLIFAIKHGITQL